MDALEILTDPKQIIQDTPSLIESRWVAAFNPVVFTFVRKDFEVTSMTDDGVGLQKVMLTSNVAGYDASQLTVDHLFYINTDVLVGTFRIAAVDPAFIVLDTPEVGTTGTGYGVSEPLFPNHHIRLRITESPAGGLRTEVAQAIYRNTPDGLYRCDVSGFLQSFFKNRNEYDYLTPNEKATGMSMRFDVAWQASWIGGSTPWVTVTNGITPAAAYFHAVNAAKQIQDPYNGNMAAHTLAIEPDQVALDEDKAKFLSGFERPTVFKGYPFDLSFVYHNPATPTTVPIHKKEEIYNSAGTSLALRGVNLADHSKYINRMVIDDVFDLTQARTKGVWIEDGEYEITLPTGTMFYVGETAVVSQLSDGYNYHRFERKWLAPNYEIRIHELEVDGVPLISGDEILNLTPADLDFGFSIIGQPVMLNITEWINGLLNTLSAPHGTPAGLMFFDDMAAYSMPVWVSNFYIRLSYGLTGYTPTYFYEYDESIFTIISPSIVTPYVPWTL